MRVCGFQATRNYVKGYVKLKYEMCLCSYVQRETSIKMSERDSL